MSKRELKICTDLINQCEADLGRKLEPGEYVDFLADNTDFTLDECRNYAVTFCEMFFRDVDAASISNAVVGETKMSKRGSKNRNTVHIPEEHMYELAQWAVDHGLPFVAWKEIADYFTTNECRSFEFKFQELYSKKLDLRTRNG